MEAVFSDINSSGIMELGRAMDPEELVALEVPVVTFVESARARPTKRDVGDSDEQASEEQVLRRLQELVDEATGDPDFARHCDIGTPVHVQREMEAPYDDRDELASRAQDARANEYRPMHVAETVVEYEPPAEGPSYLWPDRTVTLGGTCDGARHPMPTDADGDDGRRAIKPDPTDAAIFHETGPRA